MAEMKDPRGKESAPRKPDPSFSHSPDAGAEGGAKDAPMPVRRPAAKSKKKKSWFEENRTLVIGSAVGVGVLAIVLVLGLTLGWFGGHKPSSTAAPSPTSAAQPPAAPQSPPQAAPSPVPAQQPAGQTAKKDEPKKEQKPPLPDNVADWKKADYYRARRENDAKLLPAIVHLGEKFPGSSPAAQGLTDLLKPLPPERPAAPPSPSDPKTPAASGATPPATPAPGTAQSRRPPPGLTTPSATPNNPAANPTASGARPYSPADLTKLVETIIEALGCNGSKLAQGTLEQVLAGTFATDDDKTAVEATLKTLVAHPSDETDALLFRVLTATKELRTADHEGPWPVKDLQAKAFDLVKQSASSGLRTKLAAFAIAGRVMIDPKDPTNEFLLAANPLNCGAQLLFYEKTDLKKEVKATLEQELTGYSSMALARCLGISAESLPATAGVPSPMSRPRPGGPGMTPVLPGVPPVSPVGGGPVRPGETAKIEADLGSQLAGQLWSERFRGLIEPQLSTAHSLEKQGQLLVLAATIPQDSTRALVMKILRKRWYEGPKALETAGLIDRAITDPGLLPILKTSGKRRESASTPRASDTAAKRGRGAGAAAPAGGGRISDATKKQQEAEQEWMDVSAKLASGWCKRFNAAAQEAGDASNKSAGDAGEGKLPAGFELAPEAKVVASRRVILPGAGPASFSQAQPGTLEVYYVRAEESARPKKALVYYCRQAQARPADARTFEGKTWIDSCRPAPQKDRRRSIDVLITKPEGAVPAGPGKKEVAEDEVDLTIEILIIEIKDPTKE